MKLKLLALAFIGMLISCNSSETLTDNEIDASLRQTIKAKNDSLLQAMTDSNFKVLKKLGSPDFNKFMHARLGNNNMVWAFRKGFLKTDYTVFHEYYSKRGGPENTIITSEKDGYTFTYTTNDKENFVCLLKSNYHNLENYLITLIYSNIDGQWKINDLEIGQIGIYNKTSQDYFAMALKAEDEGHTIDAFMYYDTANDFLEPAGKMLKYDNEKDIELRLNNATRKVRRDYKFPKPLENISTMPAVLNIEPSKNKTGLFPLINYGTVIPVTDTVALEEEFKKVKAEVQKLYPGLDFKKDYIYYRANNRNGDSYMFADTKK